MNENCKHEMKPYKPVTGDPLQPSLICEKCGIVVKDNLSRLLGVKS